MAKGASVTAADFRGLRAKATAVAARDLADRTLTPGEAGTILALFDAKQSLHRRAQEAERALAAARREGVEFLVKKLADVGHERHLFRQENEFMKKERERLKARIRDLEAPRG